MLRDTLVYLEDIKEAIILIQEFVLDMSFDDFIKDKKTFNAVIRNIEIIGEAVKKLPENIRNLKPDIEWKKIAGTRDILIHEYFTIDGKIIWDIIKD
ncbi:MAG: DUF86 domain-containing protein [Spirochaetales bacterium]|nr:DUF86 domain-containing protein [Spirochaetales bacterium]